MIWGYIVVIKYYKKISRIKSVIYRFLYIKSGEVVSTLGENRAGKSTLMKILSGVNTKDSGEMKFFGKEQKRFDTKKSIGIGQGDYPVGTNYV